MPKPVCARLLALSLLLSSPTAFADANWYAAVRLSLGENIIDNMSHNGTVGTGMQIGNDIDGELRDTRIDDYTAGTGIAIGRAWQNWQLEGELIWRYRTDWDMEMITHSIQATTNSFANVGTTSLHLNLTRTGSLTPSWQWQAGIGVGVVRNDADVTFVEREGPNGRPELRLKDSHQETGFSYAVFVGAQRALGERWSLDARLRYIDLGELSAGPFGTRPVRLSADHEATEVQVGLVRRF